MPRGRDSRSPSRRRRPPPRRSRRDSRSRSPPRRSDRRDDRGGRGGRISGEDGTPLKEWGDAGKIVELKDLGIGFIRPFTGKIDDKDLFFHKSALKNASFDELQIGDEVTYDAVLDASKGKATAKNLCVTNTQPRPRRSRCESRSDSRGRRRH
mmetsp:Transcript_50120/g.96755  ORF Transcript_50120/g.96755 Transcript_50120/m.96755 type:complete len:153 (+) Transcript_50120:46-504(+)